MTPNPVSKLDPLAAKVRAERAAYFAKLDATGLSQDQLKFLALHVLRGVFMWQWLFRDCMLRASSDRHSVTVRRDEVEGLISAGYMARGRAADIHPTAEGKALLQ